jgi:hypothetical protein
LFGVHVYGVCAHEPKSQLEMARAFLLVAVGVWGPFCAALLVVIVSVAAGMHDIPDRAFALSVYLLWMAMPYLYSKSPALSQFGLAASFIQWAIVALVVGRATHESSIRVAMLTAWTSVLVVGVGVLLVLWLLGLEPVCEGP